MDLAALNQHVADQGHDGEHPLTPPDPLRPEEIRLIIWDLDDTLWQGTLTEGSMCYRPDIHDIVVALTRRGILNSICSKNDFDEVRKVLQAHDLWEYFVFPSIEWTSKGPRLRALVDAVQLRAESILFIDDNAGNRAEAEHYVSGLRVASELIIPTLLENPLLKGKPDPQLKRLDDYKLLQAKRENFAADGGDTAAFLRDSGIIVEIVHDLEPHLDRAIELINRTNQLNFTKRRLSEDVDAARAELRNTLASHMVKAGLLKVRDRYGDYGYTGLYVLHHQHAFPPRLLHFCFSCRILNMGVETWLYRHLGRPALQVTGDVLTDVVNETRQIDWIATGSGTAASGSGPEPANLDYVILRGGCDIHTISHYFRFTNAKVIDELHSVRQGYEPTISHTIMLRHALAKCSEELRMAAAPFGYVDADFASALAAPPSGRGVWLLSFAHDDMSMLYRLKSTRELLPVRSYRTPHLRRTLIGGNPAELGLSAEFLAHLEQNFEYAGPISDEMFLYNLKLVLDRAPGDVRVFAILGNELTAGENGAPLRHDAVIHRNRLIQRACASRDNAAAVDVAAFFDTSGAPVLGDHWDRMVYFRLFKFVLSSLEARKHETKRNAESMLRV